MCTRIIIVYNHTNLYILTYNAFYFVILAYSPYRNKQITENSMKLYTGETLAASTICTAIIALIIGFIIGLMFTARKANVINRNTSSISNRTNGNRSPVEIATNGKLKMISAGTEIYDKTLKLKR